MNHAIVAGRYAMRMSELRRFLSLMPQLRKLLLSDTIPVFDIDAGPALIEPGEISDRHYPPGGLVDLPRLHSLEWSYPHPEDVHRFLAYFSLPALTKLDVCLDGLDLGRSDHESRKSLRRVVQLDALQELSVHYVDDDSLKSALRRLEFQTLSKVEIANVDPRRRTGEMPLPELPRMDSIFRDPRMPYLTHLTISHFFINAEHGRLMLGYMPALTLLSFDTCSGILQLVEALAETGAAQNGFAVNPHSAARITVKFCPRLDSISLLGCGVAIEALRRVVVVRNTGGNTISPWSARPMKPLRRPIAIQADEASRPVKIACIRVDSVTEQEANTLREIGVEDVIWSETM